MGGCKKTHTEPPPLWERVDLSDLESSDSPGSQSLQPLESINLDVYYYEVPVDQVKTLQKVWNPLNKQGIRFKNAMSFQNNGFQFSHAQLDKLSWIIGNLEEVQAQKIGTFALILAEGYDSDLAITPLPGSHTISFLDTKGNTQSAKIGPGQLNLRLRAQKSRNSPYPDEIVAYPMVTVASHKGIEKLKELASRYEVAFMSSSFSVRIRPGDVFLLGPEEFYGDMTTLGGLFFTNPRGRVFAPSRLGGLPTHKQTVRAYVILCTSIQ
jgi:hypothetical protein